MNLQNILRTLIYTFLSIGMYGAANLVIEEFKTGNGCPKIWIIPACLIILICLIIPLVAHFFKKFHTLYFIFTGIAVSIASYASIMQYTGNGECPKLDSGTPMCYISFLIFSGLIVFKIIELKTTHTNTGK